MKESRAKLILKYVLPTILSQCAFFLFTIIDGIFVGHGVGPDGLGVVLFYVGAIKLQHRPIAVQISIMTAFATALAAVRLAAAVWFRDAGVGLQPQFYEL